MDTQIWRFEFAVHEEFNSFVRRVSSLLRANESLQTGTKTFITVLNMFYDVLYKAMLCCTKLCYAVQSYAMLYFSVLCYAVLCYAMLCYAMLCYAMLED